MKRRKARVGVLLLLLVTGGAIVNVAVAWGCYLKFDANDGRIGRNSTYRWPPPSEWVEVTTLTSLGRERIDIKRYRYRGDWMREDGLPPHQTTVLVKERAGFPCSAVEKQIPPDQPFEGLPWRPIWPGFFVNTCLYAMLVSMIWALPELRRISRSMRNLCPACAYPVGISPVCTECGKPIVTQDALARRKDQL